MDMIYHGFGSVFVYIDKILVAGGDRAEHKLYLCQLFEHLWKLDLVINMAKCQFGCSTIDFLGHHITLNSVMLFPNKVKAISNFK